MSETLVNKIAESGLITLRPEEWVDKTATAAFDIKPFLFHELILKEKDFREAMKSHDWSVYQDQVLCVYCSADAIIPSWAYMIIATRATPFAKQIFFGNREAYITQSLLQYVGQMDITPYKDQRVILKGCSDAFPIGPEVYIALTARLVPIVTSLMFGEPCSTVPVFKKSKAAV